MMMVDEVKSLLAELKTLHEWAKTFKYAQSTNVPADVRRYGSDTYAVERALESAERMLNAATPEPGQVNQKLTTVRTALEEAFGKPLAAISAHHEEWAESQRLAEEAYQTLLATPCPLCGSALQEDTRTGYWEVSCDAYPPEGGYSRHEEIEWDREGGKPYGEIQTTRLVWAESDTGLTVAEMVILADAPSRSGRYTGPGYGDVVANRVWDGWSLFAEYQILHKAKPVVDRQAIQAELAELRTELSKAQRRLKNLRQQAHGRPGFWAKMNVDPVQDEVNELGLKIRKLENA